MRWLLVGKATAVELTKDVPELAHKMSFGEGKSWAGRVGVSTRLLFLLATEGRILRVRPLGSWISSQYRWARTETWLDGELAEVEPEEARAQLARRWLHTFGPGAVADIKRWTGWTMRQTRDSLRQVGAIEVELDSGTGYVLADDVEETHSERKPWVALLPALDPTVMGWKERDWHLGGHRAKLFDRNGNTGPTVWCDGRVVGGWAQRQDGEVVVKLLDALGAEVRSMIETKAERLEKWLGETRITPRFRTPLEQELSR